MISRVEKAKYARRFVLWKSSEYKKMAINFVLEGMERLYLEICVYIFKKKSPYRFFRQGIISGTFVFFKAQLSRTSFRVTRDLHTSE